MTRIAILYADDPGGANYLAPLTSALSDIGIRVRFMVAPELKASVHDRGFAAEVRNPDDTPETLLAGADILLVGTSEDRDCFAHQLTDVARRLDLPSIGLVDMTVNAACRFRGRTDSPLRFLPSWLAVPDATCRDAYVALGVPSDRIAVCGHPHYDAVRARRKSLLGQDRDALRQKIFPDAPPARPIWLFLAEGVDRLNPHLSYRSAEYTLNGRGDSDFRACIVLEELLDAAANIAPRPWVVLRPHPKSDLADFAPIEMELGGVNRGGDPLEAVWAADLVIGMTTMLLLETLLLHRPHFSIIPRPMETAWLPTLVLGLTPFATTCDGIKRLLATGANDSADVDIALPTGATKRVLQLVIRVFDNQKEHHDEFVR